MSSRVLFALILLACGSNAAGASVHKHRHVAPLLEERVTLPEGNGPKATDVALIAPPLAPLKVFPSFLEFHSARVENDLMLFPPARVTTPAVHIRDAELFAAPPKKKPPMRFYTPVNLADPLEARRDRDKLLLFRGTQPQGASVGLGAAMFGATTILSAHAPRPLRVVFDGPVHLGPAIFDGGGMGAGISGRGL